MNFFFSIANAQEIKEFSKDTSIFIDQFEEFIDKNLSDQEEDSIESFKDKWEEGYFSDDIKNRFIDVCNFMLENKAQRTPHFVNYYNMVLTFHSSENAIKHYDNWEKGIFFIFKNEKYPLRAINEYFKHTKTLLLDSIIFSTYSTSWKVNTLDYNIIVDEDIKIEFNKTNLTCKIKNDSIDIFETKGSFYPLKDTWKGHGGYVTWERADYHPDDIKAILSNYSLDLNKSGYTADSVTFINKMYFDEPILGRLSDQVVHIMSPTKAIYPEFNSYQKRFFIENIYDGINYDGGLEMKGSNLLGSGDKDNDAYLNILRNDTTVLTAQAKIFMFLNGRIVSNNAQITIYMQRDSIYHPGISFNYTTYSKEVSLSPSERIVSKSPYFNSYQNITMNFDRLLWQINDTKIYLTKRRGAAIGNGKFTSSNFYNQIEFDKVMMEDEFHPLIVIKNFAKKKQSQTFSGSELARFLGYDDYQIKQMLMFLSVDGFLFYDTDKDEAIIKKKLYDFIDARFGKIDYDVINFKSVTEDQVHNGILDLKTFDLDINGVPEIFLSDSQNVAIYPKYGKITMKKNRDFAFAGVVNAGLFTFYGDEFYFNYDTFKISLSNINSLEIKAPTDEYDMYNNPILELIKNKIEIITGDLLIDKPFNKSGLENYSEYPIFKSYQNSFVYYDDPKIYSGVYKKDNFYFELDPFVIDSLDNFSINALRFSGTFYSANIFPPFKDEIYKRPDYSLGFERNTPPNGFPLYEGKGTYHDVIDLSNRGLKGAGKLEYLTSVAETDSIIFFPDSTKIHAKNFTMAKRTAGIEFPNIKSTNINIKWYPYEDIMYADQTKDPFQLFTNNSTLSGALVLKPTGLRGSGIMNLEKAELRSNAFTIESNSFKSDSTSFSLKSIDKKDFNFITENLKGSVNFNSQLADFASNKSFTIAKFPKNLYLSYLDQFKWHIAKDEIAIESSPQIDTSASDEVKKLALLKDDQLPGALYMSIHRSQDSLRFASTKAVYRLLDSTINATEVEYIKVADALVYPSEKNVIIGHMAKIKTLKEAEIIADSKNRFHRIYNAKVNVKGRFDYLGTGDYDYLDENKDIQLIHFTDIFVDTTQHTVAKSSIAASDEFTLSPVYDYQGMIQLNAQRKYLSFSGGVKIKHDCPRKGTYFAVFKSEINPDSIYIPINDNTRSITGRGLFAASFITKDSSHIYSRFIDERRDPNDIALVKATGYLYYNKNADKFIVTTASKHINKDTTGSLVSLQKDMCLLHAEGKVDLGIDIGQIKLHPSGSVNHLLDKNEIKLELILPMDFFFSGPALDTIAADIQSIRGMNAMSITSGFFEKNMNELVGLNDYKEFNNQIMLYAKDAKLPASTQHTMVLGKVKLKWFSESGSYLNYGQIGIATINNKPVNKYVDGYLQILKRRSGDIMKFYFKLPNNNYYYFSYTRGVMQVLSNNEDFMNVIESLKNKQRKQKTERGTTPYRYIIATNQNMSQFLRNIKLFEEEQAAKEEELKLLEQENIDLEQINENELESDSVKTETPIPDSEEEDIENEQNNEKKVESE